MDKLEDAIIKILNIAHYLTKEEKIPYGLILSILRSHQEEYEKLKGELECERLRLAACGTAALGYFQGCADEYKSASLDDVLRLRKENERLREALKEILKGKGSYSLDPLEHCANTVEDMKELAKQALESDREGECNAS